MKPINDLTEEELTREIAEWCGIDVTPCTCGKLRDKTTFSHILDYPRCHTAIASARERLTSLQRHDFVSELQRIMNTHIVFELIHASPLIQSRALVATIRETVKAKD